MWAIAGAPVPRSPHSTRPPTANRATHDTPRGVDVMPEVSHGAAATTPEQHLIGDQEEQAVHDGGGDGHGCEPHVRHDDDGPGVDDEMGDAVAEHRLGATLRHECRAARRRSRASQRRRPRGSAPGARPAPTRVRTTTAPRRARAGPGSTSSGNSVTVSSCTMRRRSASISSCPAVRARTGKAIWVMTMLILRWYSTASW